MIIKFNKFKLNEFKDEKDFGKSKGRFFMDKLYDKVNTELMPIIPDDFKIYYDGKEIIIKTDNDKDLIVGAKINGDTLSYYANPLDDVDYEYEYSFSPDDLILVFNLFKKELTKDKSVLFHNYKYKKEEPKKEEPKLKELVRPKRPKRVKRSISIPAIEDVLSEVYVDDQMILLGGLTVEELLRRMLDRDRK